MAWPWSCSSRCHTGHLDDGTSAGRWGGVACGLASTACRAPKAFRGGVSSMNAGENKEKVVEKIRKTKVIPFACGQTMLFPLVTIIEHATEPLSLLFGGSRAHGALDLRCPCIITLLGSARSWWRSNPTWMSSSRRRIPRSSTAGRLQRWPSREGAKRDSSTSS